MSDRPEALVRWLRWLKIENCTCSYRYGSLGRLYGKGWIRTDTARGCPHHEP